jgi:hypothetical protein
LAEYCPFDESSAYECAIADPIDDAASPEVPSPTLSSSETSSPTKSGGGEQTPSPTIMATVQSPSLSPAPTAIHSEPTVGLCSCSPAVYNFMLNFSGSCPGNLVDQNGEPINDAIRDLDCFTTVVADDSSDRQPVIVDTFTVLELYMEQVINSTTLRGPFQDGDVITHFHLFASKSHRGFLPKSF